MEIRVRVWAKNHWVDNVTTCEGQDGYASTIVEGPEESALELWTGQVDMNGTPIYEGDMVHVAGYGEIYLVEWYPILSAFRFKPKGKGQTPFFTSVTCEIGGKVVGNIHENKLLYRRLYGRDSSKNKSVGNGKGDK